VHDSVEKKAVIIVVSAECPITDLSKDGPCEIDTDNGLDLPHQVGTYIEPSNLAADGGVKSLVKIVAAAQADIGIEPIIVS
jgi:hypothetical protein